MTQEEAEKEVKDLHDKLAEVKLDVNFIRMLYMMNGWPVDVPVGHTGRVVCRDVVYEIKRVL